ncbi:LysR family transcriptional regulator [Thalassotalea agariperforans]
MDLDLKNLELFLKVTEIGKIGQAGSLLGLSTTNASQRLHQLESNLGVKLFHRSTRRVTLTHDGETFLQHAQRIINNLEEVKNVFKASKNIKGTLRITCSSSYGRIYIVPFIPEFLKMYPELNIKIDFSDKNVDIIEHGYDVAIRIGELHDSTLLARRLADNPMLLVASPDYLKKHGTLTHPQELINHVCLPFTGQKKWILKDKNNKKFQVDVSGPISVNWGDAISDLVEAGVGIGLAAYWHAGPALKQRKVVPIFSDHKITSNAKIWAVRPPSQVMPVRVKVFLDFIEHIIHKTNKERYEDLL